MQESNAATRVSSLHDAYNVCLACDDRYAPHAAALIVSIMENKLPAEQFVFYLFADKMSSSVKAEFYNMSHQWKFTLHITEMSDEQFKKFPKWHGNYAAYFRLAMHRFLPESVKKILYLDCDMIVTASLSELFQTDITNCYGAVVAEALNCPRLSIDYPYFNSGMILFNLEKYRQGNIEEKCIQFGLEHSKCIRTVDQDMLNYTFGGNVVYLPFSYNFWGTFAIPNFLSGDQAVHPDFERDMLEAERSPVIIHYINGDKPWKYGCQNPLRNEYWKYIGNTNFISSVTRNYYKSFLPYLSRTIRSFIIQARFGRKKKYLKVFGVTLFDTSNKIPSNDCDIKNASLKIAAFNGNEQSNARKAA